MGKAALRDISKKISTLRTAVAQATLRVSPGTITMINEGKIPKGDPFPVAKVAAIQAAKNASHLIPYCHPLQVEWVDVEFETFESEIRSILTVKAIYKTGVEMEALTAASVAALTLYDMMKMVDEEMEITSVKLLSKKGVLPSSVATRSQLAGGPAIVGKRHCRHQLTDVII